ncbi:RHS repeat-associated core domain-containing protein, partial [Desulfopila inferna]|uniref:RHS repeat-associated core domain-containing protein n=1 Tax=Desulfopila inferna TaxID=468528 RepID=UPI00196288C7
DVFGEVLAGDLDKNPYTFTGKRFDSESELYHFHFRQYDAMVGIWTTADPIGILGGINLFSYVENNPVNLVDAFGLHTGGYGGPETGDETANGDIAGGPSSTNDSHSDFYDNYDVYGYGNIGYYGNIVGLINKTTLNELFSFFADWDWSWMINIGAQTLAEELAKDFVGTAASSALKAFNFAFGIFDPFPNDAHAPTCE